MPREIDFITGESLGSLAYQRDGVFAANANVTEAVAGINLNASPNPASTKAYISYNLATDANVQLSVTNSLGVEVARLVNSDIKAGNHQVEFNTNTLPSGMYYCTFRSGETTETVKLLIMK